MTLKNDSSIQNGLHPSYDSPNNLPLMQVKDLRVQYRTPRGAVRAVDGVSFDIATGEVFGLAGESGCGKSTIAHSILRILRPPAVITGGSVVFDGEDIFSKSIEELEKFRWQEISIIFQSAMNALNPVMTVGDQMMDVIHAHERVSAEQARKRALELLDMVGIEAQRLSAYPHQLSGGMRQRVVIAIALVLNPRLIIMDEPTTALDVVMQKQIMQQIENLKVNVGFSLFFITHDLSLLVEFSDRIGIMYAGEIVEKARARELFHHPLHHYTVGLMNSFPSLTGPRERLNGIPGSPPNLINPPPGCRFHLRCPAAQQRCRVEPPKLRELRPDHFVACHFPQEQGLRHA